MALIATLSVSDAQTYPPIRKPLKIEQIPGKPVHFTVGNPGIPGQDNEGNTSNAGFVVTTDGVVVFDALGTPSHGWALLQQIRTITDKPIRYVVISHYHADHIYGLQAFKDHTEAIIIAQERAADYKENELTADERADQRLGQRREALYPWVNRDTRIVQPDLTFRNRANIVLGGKRFIVLSAGPAHSSSDSMMLVEPDGVLFAGDIVQNSRIPFMNSDDVDTESWLNAFKEVEQLDPQLIIPGHGRPSNGAKDAILFTKNYIQHIRRSMLSAVESWTDFNTAYDQSDWSMYRGMPAFEANNRGNAYRIFLELEQRQLNRDTR